MSGTRTPLMRARRSIKPVAALMALTFGTLLTAVSGAIADDLTAVPKDRGGAAEREAAPPSPEPRIRDRDAGDAFADPPPADDDSYTTCPVYDRDQLELIV
ncbi:MAG: hypothetical protein AAFQ45_04730 [Pseudomonadota bacterium]